MYEGRSSTARHNTDDSVGNTALEIVDVMLNESSLHSHRNRSINVVDTTEKMFQHHCESSGMI